MTYISYTTMVYIDTLAAILAVIFDFYFMIHLGRSSVSLKSYLYLSGMTYLMSLSSKK